MPMMFPLKYSTYDWQKTAGTGLTKKLQAGANQQKGNYMETGYAQIYNYVMIDSINGNPMKAFHVEKSKKKKGLLAPRVEIVFLSPGTYEIKAHGKTYQKTPGIITAEMEAGKYYCLGADEDGLFLEERSYEWTQK